MLASAPTPDTLSAMDIRFTKMHGLGNDFVVIDAISQQVHLSPDHIRQLGDRRFGVGCDQVLLIEPNRSHEADFFYRIYNADGSEVEQCGNGARCFARYVHDHGLFEGSSITIESAGGIVHTHIEADGQVTVNMGRPRFEPADLPFEADGRALSYELVVNSQTIEAGAVSMGNPHITLEVANIDQAPVEQLGPLLESHPRFPRRVNVGFMQIISRQHIRLRVYERGAGETLACGTGACAAVVIGHIQGKLDHHVRVSLPGGDLLINWEEDDAPVMMTGPATAVYEGEITL